MGKYKRENRISRELAQEQLDLLNEYYDVDPEYMTEMVGNAVKQQSLGILKSIVRGRLSIDATEEGLLITQYLEKPVGDISEVVYGEMGSIAMKAVDRAKTNVDKIYALVGALTKQPPKLFSDQMSHVDRSTAEDIGNYFLLL